MAKSKIPRNSGKREITKGINRYKDKDTKGYRIFYIECYETKDIKYIGYSVRDPINIRRGSFPDTIKEWMLNNNFDFKIIEYTNDPFRAKNEYILAARRLNLKILNVQ
jgi:hypothetical protein